MVRRSWATGISSGWTTCKCSTLFWAKQDAKLLGVLRVKVVGFDALRDVCASDPDFATILQEEVGTDDQVDYQVRESYLFQGCNSIFPLVLCRRRLYRSSMGKAILGEIRLSHWFTASIIGQRWSMMWSNMWSVVECASVEGHDN